MDAENNVAQPDVAVSSAAGRVSGPAHRSPWVAVGVFVGTLVVYVLTAYRTVPFWDAGEFLTTSWILGIPHQPSTPLYVLIGRLAGLVPCGSIAFRINLLSAIAAATTALFTYLAVARLARRVTPRSRLAQETAGIVAALFCAFSSTNWFNALEAEVYALSGAVMAVCVWAVLRWRDGPGRDDRVLLVLVYALSLSVGIHLGTGLVLPGLALLVALARPQSIMSRDGLLVWFLAGFVAFLIAKYSGLTGFVSGALALAVMGAALAVTMRWLNTRFILWSVALVALGVSVHLFLLIRAGLEPPINEGDPSSWGMLMDTLARRQYPLADIFVRRAPLWSIQVGHMFLRYLREQWLLFPGLAGLGGVVPLLGIIWGGVAHARRDRHAFAMMLVFLITTGPLLVLYLNFTDHEVRERDYFFAAFFQLAAIWIGLGMAPLVAAAGRRGVARVAATVILLLAMLPVVSGWRAHDRSSDWIAWDYAYNMLAPLPENSILFTNGDNDTFPLWYMQYVEEVRRDVRVVNLSLLNTTWYIQQLRDGNEMADMPSVPIHLTDQQIEMLQPRLDETGRVLYRRDLAVQQILADNNWELPVYMAVTVPDRMGLEPQLTMECLAHRIHPAPTGQRINAEICEACTREIFTPLRGILKQDPESGANLYEVDDRLHLTETERRLVQNYAAIHFYLAVEYDRDGRTAEALEEALRAEAIVPGFSGNRHFLGLLLEAVGRPEEAERHYRQALARSPDDFRTLHALGELVAQSGGEREALELLTRSVQLAGREYFQPYWSLFKLYARLGQKQQGLQVLDVWLRYNPTDEEVRRARASYLREGLTLEEMRDLPAAEDSAVAAPGGSGG